MADSLNTKSFNQAATKPSGQPAAPAVPFTPESYKERYLDLRLAVKKNAEDVCMPVWLAASFALKPALAENNAFNLTPDHLASIEVIRSLNKTPYDDFLVSQAIKDDILLCRDQNMDGWGAKQPRPDAIVYRQTTALPTHNYYKTVYEELSHSHLDHRENLPVALDISGIEHPVNQIVIMATEEAAAKTMAFYALMQRQDAEDREKASQNEGDMSGKNQKSRLLDMAAHGLKGSDGRELVSSDSNKHMAQQAKYIYERHGLATIQANPSLLLPVFMEFFRNGEEIGIYEDKIIERSKELYKVKSEEYDAMGGQPTMPFEFFKKHFGEYPGLAGNIFDGTPYISVDQILGSMPVGSKLRQHMVETYNTILPEPPVLGTTQIDFGAPLVAAPKSMPFRP
jgi:hypothetical protein